MEEAELAALKPRVVTSKRIIDPQRPPRTDAGSQIKAEQTRRQPPYTREPIATAVDDDD
jgi:hypothetical protein